MEDHFVGAKKVEGEAPKAYEGRFVGIGDGAKQIRSVEGMLLSIEESFTYPGNLVYVIGTKTEVLKVAGNTFLRDKITEIGALYRITYAGKESSKKGRAYKTFEILTVPAEEVAAKGLAKDYKSGPDAETDEPHF